MTFKIKRFPTVGFKSELNREISLKEHCGVCAALAYKLRMPTCIVRLSVLATILLLPLVLPKFLGGLPVLAYLLLAVFLPVAETPEDYNKVSGWRPAFTFHRIKGAGWYGGFFAGISYRLRIPSLVLKFAGFTLWLGFFFANLFGWVHPFYWYMVIAYVVLVVLIPSMEVPSDFQAVCKEKIVDKTKE